MQSIFLRSSVVKMVFPFFLLISTLACQNTSQDVVPSLRSRLVADDDFNALVSSVSKSTFVYYQHLSTMSSIEKRENAARINELVAAGKLNEATLRELSQLMGYKSLTEYKDDMQEIESSKVNILETFPQLVGNAHAGDLKEALTTSYNNNLLNLNSSQIQMTDKNCAGIYTACCAVCAIAGAAAIVGCGPAAILCGPLAVAAAGAGMEYCRQQAIGCFNEQASS